MARESNAVESFMPLWIADYLADTTHLTTLQHGAYDLLLFAYWRRGSALPDDDARLGAITKATPAEWRRLRPILAEFFHLKDGTWWHKRVEAELEKARARLEAARQRTEAASRARWLRDGKPADSVTESVTSSVTDTTLTQDTVVPIGTTLRAPKPRRQPSMALPPDWTPTAKHAVLALELGLSAETVPRLADAMRDWARSKDERKADWDATFNGFLRREVANGGRNTGASRETAGQKQRRIQLAAALGSIGDGSGGPALRDEDPGDGDEDFSGQGRIAGTA